MDVWRPLAPEVTAHWDFSLSLAVIGVASSTFGLLSSEFVATPMEQISKDQSVIYISTVLCVFFFSHIFFFFYVHHECLCVSALKFEPPMCQIQWRLVIILQIKKCVDVYGGAPSVAVQLLNHHRSAESSRCQPWCSYVA